MPCAPGLWTPDSLRRRQASLKVNHAHDHCAASIKGQILKSPAAIKRPRLIVDRMRDDAEASDLAGGSQRRAQREEKEGARMTAALMILVDRKLAQQRHRHRVGLVALLRFGQESPLDLRCAQGHVADNLLRSGVADDVGA